MRRSELQREKKKRREEEDEKKVALTKQRTGASRGSSGFVEMRLFFGPFFLLFSGSLGSQQGQGQIQLATKKATRRAKFSIFLVFLVNGAINSLV